MAKKTKEKIISRKRKTAVAKLRFVKGEGRIFYNGLPIEELHLFHKLALMEPIKLYKAEFGEIPQYDFFIKTMGGGKEGQIQAARISLAKALIEITGSQTLKKRFMKYDRNMVIPDSRRKETYKPGDSKARAKRQKSFR